MKTKYFILLLMITTATLYIYFEETAQTKLLSKVYKIAPELNKSTLYKWQNKKGVWQVTDTPPAKDIPFTTIKTQDQINVMPSPTAKKKK